MTRWTSTEYKQWLDSQTGEEPESRLQSKIVKWCKAKGYPCLSFRQSRKAQKFLTPGWPDLTIAIKDKVLFIELKSKKGYLSEQQKQIQLQLMQLGHEYHVVRTFKRFLEIMD